MTIIIWIFCEKDKKSFISLLLYRGDNQDMTYVNCMLSKSLQISNQQKRKFTMSRWRWQFIEVYIYQTSLKQHIYSISGICPKKVNGEHRVYSIKF